MDGTGATLILWLLILNALFAIGLLVYGLLHRDGTRRTFILFTWLTLVCPLVGPAVLAAGKLIGIITRTQKVDMSAISFSKVREITVQAPDDETEMNFVPLADAVAFSDIGDLRRLLINILKTSDRNMLASVASVIDNPDTEVSHYAATAVVDILSDFRASLQEMQAKIDREPDNAQNNVFIVEYTYQVLHMNVMNREEQQATIRVEHAMLENLFTHNLWYMKDEYYLWMTTLLLTIPDFEKAQLWVERAMHYHRSNLSTYKARLRLYYAMEDTDAFFSCMDELKRDNVPVDQELMELIRSYSRQTAPQQEPAQGMRDTP